MDRKALRKLRDQAQAVSNGIGPDSWTVDPAAIKQLAETFVALIDALLKD